MVTFIKMRQYVLSQSGAHNKVSSENEQIAELRKLLMLYIDKNDKRINEIIIALNNLIVQPKKSKPIGFCPESKE